MSKNPGWAAARVAVCLGGFLRLGNRVSASEQQALDGIEAAFETE